MWVARALWIVPLILFLLGLNQAKVARDIRNTVLNGQTADAEVIAEQIENRTEITYDYVSLRVELPDGRVIEQDKMSLPHTVAEDVKTKLDVQTGTPHIAVKVLPGSPQPLVIAYMGQTHWRIAAINAAMCFLGFLLLSFGVFAWNRYLRRRGDPALRPVAVDEAVTEGRAAVS